MKIKVKVGICVIGIILGVIIIIASICLFNIESVNTFFKNITGELFVKYDSVVFLRYNAKAFIFEKYIYEHKENFFVAAVISAVCGAFVSIISVIKYKYWRKALDHQKISE